MINVVEYFIDIHAFIIESREKYGVDSREKLW
jgi:hypothetical protein